MKTLRHKGFSYSVIIRPWRKGKKKYEVIKKEIGNRSNWCRISIDEYLKIKKMLATA